MSSRRFLPLLAALVSIAAFHAIGFEFLGRHLLGLGSLNVPTALHGRVLSLWVVFGAAATFGLALFLLRTGRSADRRWLASLDRVDERAFVIFGSLLVALLPALVRVGLLHEMPLTDDEKAYGFMAQVLAQGRLYLPSSEYRLFFDNPFLVNDGRLYAQYFLGWPLLLVPATWLGIAGFANCAVSGLTFPPLYLLARRLVGRRWAKLSLLLVATSPMWLVTCATAVSHPSCMAALLWCLFLVTKSHDEAHNPLWHGAVALAFSVAFSIRPSTALGIGLPILVFWLLGVLRRERYLQAFLAFGGVAAISASLFLAAHGAQTGSPWVTGYARYQEFSAANDFRFSAFSDLRDGFVDTNLGRPARALAISAIGWFRLNSVLFGWFASLVFLPWAWRRSAADDAPGQGGLHRVLWWILGIFTLSHLFVENVGIDTFAPMHFYELAGPLLLLTLAGARNLSRWAQNHSLAGDQRWGVCCLLACVVVGLCGYTPIRMAEVGRIADVVRTPSALLAHHGVERGVVFTPYPFIHECRWGESEGFVFAHPYASPQLEEDVIWLNHVSRAADLRLMQDLFPDRPGYFMAWDRECRARLVPLDRAPPGSLPAFPPERLQPGDYPGVETQLSAASSSSPPSSSGAISSSEDRSSEATASR